MPSLSDVKPCVLGFLSFVLGSLSSPDLPAGQRKLSPADLLLHGAATGGAFLSHAVPQPENAQSTVGESRSEKSKVVLDWEELVGDVCLCYGQQLVNMCFEILFLENAR